jgi:2-oxoglutarate ferredoxin oxidoreductase subunit delta
MNNPKKLNARIAGETTNTKKPPVTVFHAWCKRCGICVNFCPKGVLAFDDNGQVYPKNPDNCIQCFMCELRCPDFAITVNKDREKEN